MFFSMILLKSHDNLLQIFALREILFQRIIQKIYWYSEKKKVITDNHGLRITEKFHRRNQGTKKFDAINLSQLDTHVLSQIIKSHIKI